MGKEHGIPQLWKEVNEQEKVDKGLFGASFGGYIQDIGSKEVGVNYIDKIDGKSYRCKVAGSWVENTTDNFEECNISSNLDKLQNLTAYQRITRIAENDIFSFNIEFTKYGNIINCIVRGNLYFTDGVHILGYTKPANIDIPQGFKPRGKIRSLLGGAPSQTNFPLITGELDLSPTSIILYNASTTSNAQTSLYVQSNFTYISE